LYHKANKKSRGFEKFSFFLRKIAIFPAFFDNVLFFSFKKEKKEKKTLQNY